MLIISLILSVALSAEGTPEELRAAREYYAGGAALFSQRRYAEAAEAFEKAYRARPHPALFFNIGQCYEHLGNVPRAAQNYRAYLSAMPDADDAPIVRAAIERLELRARTTLVDGTPRTSLNEGLSTTAVGEQPPQKRSLRPWVFFAGGTSVVALGSGIGLGAGALGAQKQLRGEIHSREDAQALFNTASQNATAANISYALAASAALTAVVLYLISPNDRTAAGATP